MYYLEKTNDWVSDGTYLAFRYFINVIVPEYIAMGIKSKSKVIYIPIKSLDIGVFVGTHSLGTINYQEFISYIYGLSSFKGFRHGVLKNVTCDYNAPFDLKTLIYDYYGELQSEEYFSLKNNSKQEAVKEKEIIVNHTYLAYENFAKNILKEIIKEALEGKYQITEVLDSDNTSVTKSFPVPLEIRHNNLFVGTHNLGEINITEFLEYLSSMAIFMGMKSNSLDGTFEVTFGFKQLIRSNDNQTLARIK